MKCPNCNETLLMTERHRIEIDYCPNCRGVWLDKGELDKLLEQAANDNTGRPINTKDADNYTKYERENYQSQQKYQEKDRYTDNHKYPQGRKKKSFLSDLFDFD
ncbi:zf-TFIIB domain-containing protein [Sphingobacterium sp.]|uniref:TFIIB-type zinc ribbon-containing protein n=1 Tax=Sphingobacterium sp. TaxID=341027 RepID=UPI00289E4A7C|nr:zf-TFIIB domain-containing protein [Sphingobacterium sp.]